MRGTRHAAWVDRRRLRPLAWSWLLLGVPVLGIGALLLAAAWQFQRQSVPAQGVVVRHVGALGGGGPRSSRGDDEVVPVVAFVLADGVPREFQGMQARDHDVALPVGTRVRVRYQRMADGGISPRIDSFGEIWGAPMLFAAFGGVFTLCGVVGVRVSRARP